MKIMTPMYTLRRGGAYDRFIMMLEAFLERRYEVHCLSLTPIQIKNPFYHNEVADFPFKLGNGWVAKLIVLFLFPLYSLWIGRREKIDLFIAFGSLYAFILAIPKLVLKKPMVTLIRGNSTLSLKMHDSNKYLLYLNMIIEYLGLVSSDRIVTVNTALREDIVRVIGRKKNNTEVKVLFNNVPQIPTPVQEDILHVRGQLAIPEGAKLLVTAGVINRGKNIEILIKCLPKIGIDNLFLLIVGDGFAKADLDYRNHLRKLTEKFGVDRRVIFTGWLEKDELWKIFHAADLFVLPSKSEGMPNSMLEALGSDLPCFGSRVPGIMDILHDEELMFDPMDEQAIIDKVWRFFSDVQYFHEIKELCQKRKKDFIFDWKEKVFQVLTGGSYDKNRYGTFKGSRLEEVLK